MRTRIASVATALLLATAALGATTGTALMATTTTLFGGGANGQVLCEYTYDSTTDVLQSLIAINNDSKPHTVSGSALNPTTLAVVASGTAALGPSAQHTWNISAFNLKMVTSTAKDGSTFLVPPFIMSCAIS